MMMTFLMKFGVTLCQNVALKLENVTSLIILHLLANLLPQVLQQQLIRAERERILQQFQSGKLPAESLGQAAQLFNEVVPCLEILTLTLKAS